MTFTVTRQAEFFAYARERYDIMLRKDADLPKPWTTDKILQSYRFCNVFREDDIVTKWFRTHIRDPLKNDPRVLLATFAFRIFNLPESGRKMLGLGLEGDDFYAFSTEGWHKHKDEIRRRIKAQTQKVTGAYMTKTPTGLDKVDGCIQVVDWFIKHCDGDTDAVGREFIKRNQSCDSRRSLQATTEWMTESPFMGPFLSYEVVTDLRHTALLNHAPDINTWANPGPGAARGLSRVCGLDIDALKRERKQDVEIMQILMRELLSYSQDPRYWSGIFPPMEMRDIEHTLCEFDKYERVRLEQGRPRSKYNGAE